ncbi:MAG: hypothetical protein HW390_930 [Candidatus Brocadiaceae bacterium]|nr:hypothetical protein [Candidatus Brocadiaceae bacterium]
MSDTSPDSKSEFNTPKPPNPLESLNSILAFQVQDLIDKKLDKAESRLHNYNMGKWKLWGSVAAAIFTTVSFVGYQFIIRLVTNFVEKKMTEPALIKATEETISKRMPEFVDNKFKSVEEKVEEETDKLSNFIETTKSEIREKQNLLENAQSLLKEQLNIQQCAIAAKAGARGKYEELKIIAEKKLEYKEFVDAALKDIEFYYEAIKYELATSKLVDSISKKDPGYSIEEVIYLYCNSDVKLDFREAAIDTLIDYNNTHRIKDNVVQELCESVNSEQNLRVIARTTLLLNSLTGRSFRALDMDAVRVWWEQNKNETKYQSPFKDYLKVYDYEVVNDTKEREQIISLLDKCIQAEPDAFHARCLRGFNLMLLNDFDKAEKEFKIVEERNKDFRWLLLFRSVLFACQNKTDEAVGLLNQALAKSPAIKDSAKELSTKIVAYKKVVEDGGVKWPDDKR